MEIDSQFNHALVTDKPIVANSVYTLLTKNKSSVELIAILADYGYQAKNFNSVKQLIKIVPIEKPVLLLVDMTLISAKEQHALSELKKHHQFIMIVLSAQNTFEAQLQGIRLGAHSFHSWPVDSYELIKKINREINFLNNREPYRITLMKDAAGKLPAYVKILEKHGFKINIVTEPARLLSTVLEFKPDVVLMDTYAQHCSGVELADLLKQQNALACLPIVFYGKEKDLLALKIGADDFLNKNLTEEKFLAKIEIRAQRYRDMRRYMVSDSLTELYNHDAIEQKLLVEIDRAERHHQALAIAMIDIDDFKHVNDNYGHVEGDKILKEFSALLNRRLRKTDIAGRYGGEEFLIIFPHSEAEAARVVCDKLRILFSDIAHQFSDIFYHVTFSAGIAVYPEYQSLADLCMAADKALYAAKKSGKNTIRIAAPRK